MLDRVICTGCNAPMERIPGDTSEDGSYSVCPACVMHLARIGHGFERGTAAEVQDRAARWCKVPLAMVADIAASGSV